MTPLLLAGFCAALTAAAVGRYALEDDADRADAGGAVVAAGVTALALSWATLEAGSAAFAAVLAVLGVCAGGVGVRTIGRHV